MCKFYVSWQIENINPKNIVLADIALRNSKDEFTAKDIIPWMMKLNLYWKPFDNIYSKYDILRVQKNTNYVLSFFYSHKAKAVYMSIICHNEASMQKVIKLLEEIKELKLEKNITYIEPSREKAKV
jgi:hypothetical protein